jgi:DNA primase
MNQTLDPLGIPECRYNLGLVASEIMLCEGPDDGLPLRQRFPGASVWVSLGTGNLPFVELPDAVEFVVVAADNNIAGYAAAEAAGHACARRGRSVAVLFPDPAYKAWNDELMSKRI